MRHAMLSRLLLRGLLPAILGLPGGLHAGPYSAGLNDPAKVDAPIPGFTGPDGVGAARLFTGNYDINGDPIFQHPRNFVNPLFFAWADLVTGYAPAPDVAGAWSNPTRALGPVTGDDFHIVSLGDLPGAGTPGTLTVRLAHEIHDLTGADFAVFENAFLQSPATGAVFGELAFVEVSADGVTFVRFPARSLTAGVVGPFNNLAPSDVHNLAGKHVNSDGQSWGTPFDLAETGLAVVRYIRLVDIPGTGTTLDSLGQPIYDPSPTTASGGADIEAVGAISRRTTFDEWQDLRDLSGDDRGPDADPNGNGLPNLLEYAFSRLPAHNADSAPPVTLEKNAGRLEIIFTRDERATDLTYEVQARDNLATGPWITIASSTAGAPVTGTGGSTPAITETSASPIATIGVVRKVRVADVQTLTGHASRFLRIKVTALPP